MSEDDADFGHRMRERGRAEEATATEAELAHARDVTITECQEHLLARGQGQPLLGAILRDAARSLDELRSHAPVVHLLHHGRALCGMKSMPRDWPVGHRWVDISLSEAVNCDGCKATAVRLTGVGVGR
jgi:hypothetical protein